MPTLPPGYEDIHTYANEIITFLHEPLSLQITGGIHVNDAFIHNAWNQLPAQWTTWWESLPTPQHAQKDLINALRSDSEARKEDLTGRPESLSRWLERIRHLSLPREQMILPDEISGVTIPGILADRMVTKKLGEVQAGARYIEHICKRHNITRVVDVGSGQGYLSLTLAASCGLKVLAIDGSETQIAGSQAAAREAGLVEGESITHLVRYITSETTPTLGHEISTWANGEKVLLTGLHACGSLSEHMLRLSTSVPAISYIAVVGCCFNHITPLSTSDPNGFPISRFMRERGLKMKASALVTGCQAPTNWTHTPNSGFGRKAWYRAVLEKLLYDKGLSGKGEERKVWGIRNGDLKSLAAYTSRALSSLNLTLGTETDIHTDITTAEIAEYERRYEARKGEIAILQTLSVMLCRVVESVIALDRVFFLMEEGMEEESVDVVAVFEYEVSPRNLMVVGKKEDVDGRM
jgi:hypothetical protein